VSDMSKIGVFAAKGQQGTAVFFGYDDQTLVSRLYEDAALLVKKAELPVTKEGTVRRIGEVEIQAVKDDACYRIEPVGKPETGRKPSGDVGAWAIQSLVFDKDTFTLDQAKAWVTEHSDNFGYYGHDETDTSYRFRQYDPEYFDEFRTTVLTDGIAAVYGKIAGAATDQESAKAAIEDSIQKHLAVRKINESILKQVFGSSVAQRRRPSQKATRAAQT
jgi:hypothetical protein